jgi:hypothetical protein
MREREINKVKSIKDEHLCKALGASSVSLPEASTSAASFEPDSDGEVSVAEL